VLTKEATNETLSITRPTLVKFGFVLSARDADALQRLFRARHLTGEAWLLEPRSPPRVGQITIGTSILECPPPFPIVLFLGMYLYCYGMEFNDIARLVQPAVNATADGVLNVRIVLEICFLTELQRLLDKGISKQYVYRDEKSLTLRGRVDWSRTMASRIPTSSSAELTANHPLNRMLYDLASEISRSADFTNAGLSILAPSPQRWRGITPQPIAYHAVIRWLATLAPRVAHYRPVLVLARALLAEATTWDSTGTVEMPELFHDLATLFERFVQRLLSDELAHAGTSIEVQVTDTMAFVTKEGASYSPIRPDFIIRRADKRPVVIDAKFKPQYCSGKRVSTSDLFQVAFYCTRYGDDDGPAFGFIAAPAWSAGYIAHRHIVHHGSSGDVLITLAPLPLIDMLRALIQGERTAFASAAQGWLYQILREASCGTG